MYENRNQPSMRDGSSRYRSRSPPPARHRDGWDRDYYRSRNDPHSPSNEAHYRGESTSGVQDGPWNGSQLPGPPMDEGSIKHPDFSAQSYTQGAAFPVQSATDSGERMMREDSELRYQRPPGRGPPEENVTTYDPFPVPGRYGRGSAHDTAGPISDTMDEGAEDARWRGPTDSRYDEGSRREDDFTGRDQRERYEDKAPRRDGEQRSSHYYDEDDRGRASRGSRNDMNSRYRDDREEGSQGFRERRENFTGGRRGPSRTLQIGTLPDDATERDILYGLDHADRDPNISSEKVKVVRIREDRRGRRIALAEFYRSSDAEGFLRRHGTSVSFPLENSRGGDSKPLAFNMDFAEREERDEMTSRDYGQEDFYDDGWTCPNCDGVNYPGRYACYKCRTERPDDGYGQDYEDRYGPVLTGETDECPRQETSHYVVIRDLHGSVTEEVLAKGVSKLFVEKPAHAKDASSTPGKLKSTAPTNSASNLGAKPDSLLRVFLMRDRKTDGSWRYGFAEFATIDDARAAVAKFQALPKFTISSRPVTVAFIHSGVFIPAGDNRFRYGDDREFSFAPITNPSIRLRYWDERAYPSVLVVSEPPKTSATNPKESRSADGPDMSSKGSGVRSFSVKRPKKEKETGAKAIAMAPQMQMWAKKAAELHGFKKVPVSDEKLHTEKTRVVRKLDQDQSKTVADTEPVVPRLPMANDQYVSYADWDNLTCLVCGIQAPAENVFGVQNMGHYTREQWLVDHEVKTHDLYKNEDSKKAAAEKLAAIGKEPKTIVRRIPRSQNKSAPKYKSYADRDALVCHLCSRRFKHSSTLLLHEQESELHKRMLSDPSNAERATEELKAKGLDPVVMRPSQRGQSLYRDRALERRVAFNQPKKPSNKPVNRPAAEKRKETASPAAAPSPEEPLKKSKGAGMLAKMGWTAGAGLGAEGAGRTEAVATDAYAPGVGLGAEGGKLGDAAEEAARNTRGNFSDFVEKTREKAKERYNRL